VCAVPQACSDVSQGCTAGGGECCTGLGCLQAPASGQTPVSCGSGDPASPCYCDYAAACVPEGPATGPCDASNPCCPGLYCVNPYSSQPCTGTACECAPAGCRGTEEACDAAHPCCSGGECKDQYGSPCSGTGCTCVLLPG
jgi:hypothetical protein